jgi:anti-sigma regulatory factor (Ser/Thr protein kinase)
MPSAPPTAADRFSHEVLFYAGRAEFVERMAAFTREGIAAGEPVLVMVTGDKVDALREELGPDAAQVEFADMGVVGRNPGRIISAWHDFAREHAGPGVRLRGIGEPIFASRDDDELEECQHHEALINLAFTDAAGFRLMCPYDTESLPPAVIEEARRAHPRELAGELRGCTAYRELDPSRVPGGPLPPPRASTVEMPFQPHTLEAVRRLVSENAEAAGLPRGRVDDLVMAVNETCTNSVRYGGGDGVVRVWRSDISLVCETRDRGRIPHALVGRVRPESSTGGGHGLWLAHQVCDLVQVRSDRSGTVVRMHMRLP